MACAASPGQLWDWPQVTSNGWARCSKKRSQKLWPWEFKSYIRIYCPSYWKTSRRQRLYECLWLARGYRVAPVWLSQRIRSHNIWEIKQHEDTSNSCSLIVQSPSNAPNLMLFDRFGGMWMVVNFRRWPGILWLWLYLIYCHQNITTKYRKICTTTDKQICTHHSFSRFHVHWQPFEQMEERSRYKFWTKLQASSVTRTFDLSASKLPKTIGHVNCA